MNFAVFDRPLFYAGQHYVSTLGLIAFAVLFAVGLTPAKILQSGFVRRLFSRLKLEANFVAIVTTILSLAALVFFTVTAVNAAGIPLAWSSPLPSINLSLIQLFLLIRVVGRRLLDFLEHQTISLQPHPARQRPRRVRCNTPSRKSSAKSSSSLASSL